MPVTDLATIDQVKLWMPNAPVSANNERYSALISAASQGILTYLQRSTVLLKAYTDVFNGYGQRAQMLRHWPVTSITSMSINATSIAPSLLTSNPNNGFVLDPWDGDLPGGPQMISLRGRDFCDGTQNISISYKAGYLVSSEAQTIPADPYKITVDQINGPWAQDEGVVGGDGTVFVKVASAPAVGQYSVKLGVYTFNSADTTKAVLISYSFIPSPLNQGCVMMVSELDRYSNRIGERSRTTPGPQTTAFDNSIMTDAIKMLISQFCNVVPIQ